MLKCAVIGCGVIAPTHIEGYQALPDVEVVAVCDLIEEKARKLAEKYHVGKVCTDYHQLLSDPAIEAVSVCTDHASHAQIVIDVLNAGKHVICEKSAGRVSFDLKQMTDAAKAHPELVSSGIFQHRFEPANIALKELLKQQKFGKLIMVTLTFSCLRTNEYYRHDAWRGTIAGEGGGILINQAIHHLDQLRFLFGNVKKVAAKTANLTHQGVIEVEDTAAFVAEFESGLLVTVAATNSAAATWRSFLSIIGTEAVLEYANERPVHVEGPDPARCKEIEEALTPEKTNLKVAGKSYYGAGHTAQLADFTAAIREKRPAGEPLTDAADSSALIMAVYQSAASGKWEDVADYR